MQSQNILVLGGTGLTGPHMVRYALQRGHRVTVFNRGKTRANELPAGVEELAGDRTTGDLSALEGRQWDVCIDVPTSLPAWVRDAGRALHRSVKRYIFISTISVYADASRPLDEDSPLATYEGADPCAETMDTLRASGFSLYGPLKAACEQEAKRWFPGRCSVVRPGLIAGPGDQTDRVTYWPLRIAGGGDVLAPGSASDPVQFIDVRDLAEWTIRMAEQGTTGAFNATGPGEPLSIGEMLQRTRDALGSDATFTWVPAGFLESQGIKPWSDMPAWLPPHGEDGGMMRASVSRAVDAGLTFRPLETTMRDALQWFRAQPAERQAQPRAGVSAQKEAEVLRAWRESR